jgi:glycine hydroxymethyltransferase
MSELQQMDPEIANLITREEARQHRTMRLIPSENYAWPAVMEACGSVLNNKYSEGYAGKRYYEGQQNIDAVEKLAVDRVKQVFGMEHANVQPYSGSPGEPCGVLRVL